MKTLKTLLLILASLTIISCGCSTIINDFENEDEVIFTEVKENDESETKETKTRMKEETKENTEVTKKSVKEDSISENKKYEIEGYELLYVIKNCNVNIKQAEYNVIHNDQTCCIKKHTHDGNVESIRIHFGYVETNGATENDLYIYHIDNDVAIYNMKTKYNLKSYVNSASFENNTISINADIISSL